MTTYMTGYAGKTMTREQLLQWTVWQRFEPEFRRRLLALMDECIAAGKPIGIGGGWRSSEAQRSLFLSRYRVEDDNDLTGDTFFEGKYWEKLPGVAAVSPVKQVADELNLPLIIGVLSNDRTRSKVRMY